MKATSHQRNLWSSIKQQYSGNWSQKLLYNYIHNSRIHVLYKFDLFKGIISSTSDKDWYPQNFTSKQHKLFCGKAISIWTKTQTSYSSELCSERGSTLEATYKTFLCGMWNSYMHFYMLNKFCFKTDQLTGKN